MGSLAAHHLRDASIDAARFNRAVSPMWGMHDATLCGGWAPIVVSRMPGPPTHSIDAAHRLQVPAFIGPDAERSEAQNQP